MSDLWKLIQSDVYRTCGRKTVGSMVKNLLYGEGFAFCFWFRICQHILRRRGWVLVFYPFPYLVLRHLRYKLGISIPAATRIGPGLYIGHFGGIVVNGEAAIGANCNLSHGVTIGQIVRGARQGVPTIGDRVFIGPGAKLLGNIHIGDDAAIGANAVVVKDVPSGGVVAGPMAVVLSQSGSQGYINRIDY